MHPGKQLVHGFISDVLPRQVGVLVAEFLHRVSLVRDCFRRPPDRALCVPRPFVRVVFIGVVCFLQIFPFPAVNLFQQLCILLFRAFSACEKVVQPRRDLLEDSRMNILRSALRGSVLCELFQCIEILADIFLVLLHGLVLPVGLFRLSSHQAGKLRVLRRLLRLSQPVGASRGDLFSRAVCISRQVRIDRSAHWFSRQWVHCLCARSGFLHLCKLRLVPLHLLQEALCLRRVLLFQVAFHLVGIFQQLFCAACPLHRLVGYCRSRLRFGRLCEVVVRLRPEPRKAAAECKAVFVRFLSFQSTLVSLELRFPFVQPVLVFLRVLAHHARIAVEIISFLLHVLQHRAHALFPPAAACADAVLALEISVHAAEQRPDVRLHPVKA